MCLEREVRDEDVGPLQLAEDGAQAGHGPSKHGK